MPVTIAMPPEFSRQTVSSLLVPFSSFSIDSCRRLVMIVVFTDALICAMRSRYGAAFGDLPHGDSLNWSATLSSLPSAQSFCSSSGML